MDKLIKEYLKKEEEIYKILNPLYDKLDRALSKNAPKEKIEELRKIIDEAEKNKEAFIDEFAKYVFDLNLKKKPKLYDRFAKKSLKWDEVFGDDFESISKLKRVALTRLYDKDGKYKIK